MSLRLLVLWLHLLGASVWLGGLVYQSHALLPGARRGESAPFADAARRARPATWTAIALVVLTGFYNVTQLGSLERVTQSGAGLLLIAKFALVVVAVALAGQRDFAQLPLVLAALATGGDARPALAAMARLDRVVLVLAAVVVYLGLAVSRAVSASRAMPRAAATSAQSARQPGEIGMPSRRRRRSHSASGSPAT